MFRAAVIALGLCVLAASASGTTEDEWKAMNRKFTEAAGFTCTAFGADWQTNETLQRWIDEGALEVEITEHAGMKDRLAMFLYVRFLAGDAPRYQTVNPVDLSNCLAKYQALTSQKAAGRLLARAVVCWREAGKRKLGPEGTHPLSVVKAEGQALAAEFDLAEYLPAWVNQ